MDQNDPLASSVRPMPDLMQVFDVGPAPADRDSFTIGELTREFGITARTIRFYEEKGFLAPQRRGQDRLFSRGDRARLKLVLMGKGVGFSLDEVKEMLDLYDLGDGGLTQLKVAHERFGAQIARLQGHKAAVERAIRELERARAAVHDKLNCKPARRD